MNKNKIIGGKAGLILLGSVFSVLTGCIGYVDAPRRERVYVQPAPVQVEIVSDDDYVYYPGYQVYYSRSRRHYVYLEGRAWVTRPAPPRVSVSATLRPLITRRLLSNIRNTGTRKPVPTTAMGMEMGTEETRTAAAASEKSEE